MEKCYDVVALGELLIDFTQSGISAQGNPIFEANPGGAPCNVLAMLQKLGRKTAFLGKVGADGFGEQLRQIVREAGVDVSCLRTDPAVHTTLAIVQNMPDGDRDFSFYRNPGADMMLSEDELDDALLNGCSIFHFGTLSMTHPGVRAATKTAVLRAKRAGARISFDPNLRPPLWNTLEDAREQIAWGLSQCDILKIADNELSFLFPDTAGANRARPQDYTAAANALLARYPNIRLLNVTFGANGSCAFCGGQAVYAPAFLLGGTVDTTGAGDCFCACVLHDVLENGLENRCADSLRAMLRFANAAAYLVTTKKGAIRSMPTPEQIAQLLS